MENEPSQEDEYFEDATFEIGDLLVNPENTIIEIYTGHTYDHLATQLSDDPEDIFGTIVPGGVLQFLAHNGFRVHDNGVASDYIREWYAHIVIQSLDDDIVEWQQQNP